MDFEFLPILLSAVAGLASGFVGSFLKDMLATKSTRDSLKYEIRGKESIDVPAATDLESLQTRISSLESVSPRLAVLDGWSLVSKAIVRRASSNLGADYKPSHSTIQIARDMPDLPAQLIQRLERLQSSRNNVAHDVASLDQDSLKESVTSIVPILQELGLSYITSDT